MVQGKIKGNRDLGRRRARWFGQTANALSMPAGKEQHDRKYLLNGFDTSSSKNHLLVIYFNYSIFVHNAGSEFNYENIYRIVCNTLFQN